MPTLGLVGQAVAKDIVQPPGRLLLQHSVARIRQGLQGQVQRQRPVLRAPSQQATQVADVTRVAPVWELPVVGVERRTDFLWLKGCLPMREDHGAAFKVRTARPDRELGQRVRP